MIPFHPIQVFTSDSNIIGKALSGKSSFSSSSSTQGNSNHYIITESDCCTDLNKMSSLSDPLGLYNGLGRNVDISGITINKPEVRNCNGTLVHPREYRSVLKDRAFVGVQVYFKM